MSAFDEQLGGNHYKDMKFQPIEFILANGLGFCEGNVVKYVCRYKAKGGLEDLKKAKHYLELLIETVEKTPTKTYEDTLYEEIMQERRDYAGHLYSGMYNAPAGNP